MTIAAASCAQHQTTPLDLADQTTRAVYAGDYDGTTSRFDDELKRQVTREQVGALSDKMHALGAYKSLAQTKADPDRGRYDYDATFDRGHLVVLLRIDPSGKIGAYRIAPSNT